MSDIRINRPVISPSLFGADVQTMQQQQQQQLQLQLRERAKLRQQVRALARSLEETKLELGIGWPRLTTGHQELMV